LKGENKNNGLNKELKPGAPILNGVKTEATEKSGKMG